MSPPPRREPSAPVYVTLVSDNPETLDGLQLYFQQAGVGAHGTRQVSNPDMVPASSSAVVFFPDDFDADAVVAAVVRLRRVRPAVLPILVTADPNRFRAVTDSEGAGPTPVILPKPAWGWTILDAIRGHSGTAMGGGATARRAQTR